MPCVTYFCSANTYINVGLYCNFGNLNIFIPAISRLHFAALLVLHKCTINKLRYHIFVVINCKVHMVIRLSVNFQNIIVQSLQIELQEFS